jgi:hypothetical protein
VASSDHRTGSIAFCLGVWRMSNTTVVERTKKLDEALTAGNILHGAPRGIKV